MAEVTSNQGQVKGAMNELASGISNLSSKKMGVGIAAMYFIADMKEVSWPKVATIAGLALVLIVLQWVIDLKKVGKSDGRPTQ